MKVVLVVLFCTVLAVAARAQIPPNLTPAPEAVSPTLAALLGGANRGLGLADFITSMNRETDPAPLLEQRGLLARLQGQANEAYAPAIMALINACDTALQLHSYLQDETPAIREAVPRYQRGLTALRGFPPANAVDAALLRNWQQGALAAERFYAQAEALRAAAIQYCLNAAALKASGDQTINNP